MRPRYVPCPGVPGRPCVEPGMVLVRSGRLYPSCKAVDKRRIELAEPPAQMTLEDERDAA